MSEDGGESKYSSLSMVAVETICKRIHNDPILRSMAEAYEQLKKKYLSEWAASQTKHISTLDRVVALLWLERPEELTGAETAMCKKLAEELEAVENKNKVIPFPKK